MTDSSDTTALPAAPAVADLPLAGDPADGGPGVPEAEGGAAARPTWHGVWREWVRPFLVVLLVVFSLRSAVADWNDVPTGSMRPTILEGERIFVNKLAYDLKFPFTRLRLAEWSEPRRGDVVVLYSPAEGGKRLVKRVLGVPGDHITVRSGRVLVNGEPADYRPLGPGERAELGIADGSFDRGERVVWETIDGASHPVAWLDAASGGLGQRHWGPDVVPADEFFVMGDNRDNSSDSRVFGYVGRSLIVGRATAVVFSLDPEHHRAPRWERFFQPLP
jgi:signal peptidase I